VARRLRTAVRQAEAGERIFGATDATAEICPNAEVVLLDARDAEILVLGRIAEIHAFAVVQSLRMVFELLRARVGSKEPMEESNMGAVLAALEPLQIVAFVVVLGHESIGLGCREHLIVRKEGRLALAHVREDDPALFETP